MSLGVSSSGDAASEDDKGSKGVRGCFSEPEGEVVTAKGKENILFGNWFHPL
jgi:hypothetical protein